MSKFRALLLRPLLPALLALLLAACDEDVAEAPPEPAPDFTLELFSGERFELAKYQGRALIINVFASWCIPCKAEAPELEKVYRDYRQKGVLVLGVAVNDTEEAARGFVAEHGITFPTGLDADGKFKAAYRVYGVPHSFFIDGKGLIRYAHVGAVNEELLKHELDKML